MTGRKQALTLAEQEEFDVEHEWALFDLQRAYQFLSAYIAVRQVAKNGAVCLLDYQYSVGAKYAGQTVTAQFIPAQVVFRFRTAQGEFIRDLPAPLPGV
jgi:hypothetical protein